MTTPFETWLALRESRGQRVTLVDLYELEAASRGITPDLLSADDRARLKADARAILYPGRAAVLPGSDRPGDPHEVCEYDATWPLAFERWRERLDDALGAAALRIDHVGSTAVPGLAAKPIIDIMVSVSDTADESAFLPELLSAGLILRMREHGHLLLWPPPDRPREVHVHVCDADGEFARDEVLFRDYLRANSEIRDEYAALKRELIDRWHDDRKAYTAAKTAFVIDALEAARA